MLRVLIGGGVGLTGLAVTQEPDEPNEEVLDAVFTSNERD